MIRHSCRCHYLYTESLIIVHVCVFMCRHQCCNRGMWIRVHALVYEYMGMRTYVRHRLRVLFFFEFVLGSMACIDIREFVWCMCTSYRDVHVWMEVCACVCLYLCPWIKMPCIYFRLEIFMCECIHVSVYICMYACICVCMHAYMHACMCLCVNACMYPCMCMCLWISTKYLFIVCIGMHRDYVCMYVCMYVRT